MNTIPMFVPYFHKAIPHAFVAVFFKKKIDQLIDAAKMKIIVATVDDR